MVTVLVVDDDPPIRRMLERTFAAEGYRAQAAADGGEALAAVERSVPDLLVLGSAVVSAAVAGLAATQRRRDRLPRSLVGVRLALFAVVVIGAAEIVRSFRTA